MKRGQVKVIELALFPMEYMRITQGINNAYSHKGTMAIDIAGKDTGSDPLFAPFTGKVVRKGTDGSMLFESVEKVLWADGRVDYALLWLYHDENTSDAPVGKVFKQGEKFYDEGKAGKATGNHVHLNVAPGRWDGQYPFVKNLFGKTELRNEIEPFKLFWVNDTIILKDGGYNWKKF